MADPAADVHESAGQFTGHASLAEVVNTPEDVALHNEVMDCYRFERSYNNLQDAAELEATEFKFEDMWPTEFRDARSEDQTEEGDTIPARPALEVDLLEQHQQQVLNEARQARLAITVKPRTGLANTKTGDRMKALVRTIQVDSGALSTRLWALEGASGVGRGHYIIEADYANDDDFDIDLIIQRLLDQGAVGWDPYAQRSDNEDAQWCQVRTVISEQERKRRWKNKPFIAPDGAFEDSKNPLFVADPNNPKQRSVVIVTHYAVRLTERKIGHHPGWGTGPVDQMPAEMREAVEREEGGTRLRRVFDRKVEIVICDGASVLEKKEWKGRYIPVILVPGKEYFLKGKRRYKGVIEPTMDILRAINVILSSAVELSYMLPRAPYMMYEGQDEGFEDEWDDALTVNRTRLRIKAKMDTSGRLYPFPQRQTLNVEVQGLMLLLRVLQDMFHGITGNVAPSLRAIDPTARSGKLVEALQRQGQAGSSNFLDNLATISMPYEGKVLIDAVPHYYDREGRVLMVSGEDHEAEQAIMIKRPFILNDEGMPVAVPCPVCQGEGRVSGGLMKLYQPMACPECKGGRYATKENMPDEFQGQPVDYVDFSEGKYRVMASVDRSYEQQQAEALAGMEHLAGAAPELVPLYADLWVRAMGFTYAGEIADRLKANNPALRDEDGMKNMPPAVRSKLQALQAQHQQAMQALQAAQQVIETDKVKQLGQKEIATIKAALEFKKAQLQGQQKMIEIGAKGQADAGLETLRGTIQGMLQESDQRFQLILQSLKELGLKEIERHKAGLHETAEAAAMARMEQSEDKAAMREVVASRAAEEREEGREVRAHEREQGAQVAAETREEGREVRSGAREEGAEVRQFGRETAVAREERKADATERAKDRVHERQTSAEAAAAKAEQAKAKPKAD